MSKTQKTTAAPTPTGPAPRLDAWEVLGMGGFGGQFDPLVSPHDTNLVLMRCDMTGAYISHDGGLSWRCFSLRSMAPYFTYDPGDPQVIYGGNLGLWRSEDTGDTWSLIWPDPQQNTVEHACDDHSDAYLTTDDPSYPGPDTRIAVVAVHPKDSSRLYMATEPTWFNQIQEGKCPTLILTSPDRGKTWEKLVDLEGEGAHALHVTETGRVYVVRPSGVWVVEEGKIERFAGPAGGISWSAIGEQDGKLVLYVLTAARWEDAEPNTGQTQADKVRWEGSRLQGGVYVSEDEGRTWRSCAPAIESLVYHPGGKPDPEFTAMCCSAQHGATAYVGFRFLRVTAGEAENYFGVLKTTDAGRTWEVAHKERPGRPSPHVDTGHFEGRVMSEHDPNVYYYPMGMGAAPTNPDMCFLTEFRVLRTMDGGKTWQSGYCQKVGERGWRSTGADVTVCHDLQFDPFDPAHMLLGYADIGLQGSTDGGYSWFSANETIPAMWRNTTYTITFDPEVRGLVWADFGYFHCLPRCMVWSRREDYRALKELWGAFGISHDGGENWELVPDLQDHVITSVVLDPTSPVGSRTLYAASFANGVYKSTDNGCTWAKKNAGIEGDRPFIWKLARAADGALYLLVHRQHGDLDGSLRDDYDGAIYRSTDGAETWVKLSLPENVNGPVEIACDPGDAKRMYLTAWGRYHKLDDKYGGVFLSTDGGKTWRNTLSKMQHANGLTVDPKHPNRVYATGFDAAAYRSLDKGETWERIKGYSFRWNAKVVPDPVDDEKIYICTWGGGLWHGPAAGDPDAVGDIVTPIKIAME